MPRFNVTSTVIAMIATRPGCWNSRRRAGTAAAGVSAIDSEANARLRANFSGPDAGV